MNAKEIILQPEIKYVAVDFEVLYANDYRLDKMVKCKFNLIADDGQKYDYPEVTLWEGDAYDAIGAWTDADVDARIEELLSA